MPLLAYHLAAFTKIDIPIQKKNSNIEGSQLIFRQKKFLPHFKIMRDVGKYIKRNNQIIYQGEDYYPERLDRKEFYLIKNHKQVKTDDQELFRLESKQKVLDRPGKLSSWIVKMIS